MGNIFFCFVFFFPLKNICKHNSDEIISIKQALSSLLVIGRLIPHPHTYTHPTLAHSLFSSTLVCVLHPLQRVGPPSEK